MTCSSAPTWGPFLNSLTQTGFIIAGWWVVHRLSKKREYEKSKRDLTAAAADSVIEMSNKILTEACTYHTTDRCVASEIRLKGALQDMGLRSYALKDICGSQSSLELCGTDIVQLRRAVTSKHFEDEHLIPLVDGDVQLEEIAEAVLRVKRAFLQLKYGQFPR